MSTLVPNSPQRDSGGFQKVVGAFLSGEGLPFADILSAERIQQIFAKHGCQFGSIYTAAIMVWSFLSQVLRDGKEASCQSAVARVVSHYQQQGLDPPTEDTGDYCRARAKLSEQALHELSCEVAEELEETADPNWLWKDKLHPKLIDGLCPYLGEIESGQVHKPHPAGEGLGDALDQIQRSRAEDQKSGLVSRSIHQDAQEIE